MQGRSFSFGSAILGWTLALSLIPTATLAVQGYHCASEAVTASIQDDLANVAAGRATQLEDWVDSQKRELEHLTMTACLPAVCGDECACCGPEGPAGRANRLLGSFRDALTGFAGIAVIGEDTLVRGSIGRFPALDPDLALRARELLEEGRASGVSLWQNGSQPLQCIAGARLVGKDGKGAGALLALLDLGAPTARILRREIGFGSSGSAYLVTPEGRRVDAAANGAGKARALLASDLVKSLKAKADSGMWRDADGRRVVGGIAPVPTLGLSLVVERDYRDALDWLPILARRALIVGALAAIAVFLFSRLMASRLSRPLKKLADVARGISAGDTAAHVPEMAVAELADVRTALNDMLDALQQSRVQLAQSAALAAVGELSSSIVHEMRNPLSSVKMNLQALRRQVAGDPVHAELAEIAEQQAVRMERILGDLLDFGKPLQVAPRPTTHDEIVRSAWGSVEGLARQRSVALVQCREDSIPGLHTDPERLAQALENLLKNAVEASPEGQEVCLRISAPAGPRGVVAFEVEDRGPGLPRGSRERLFQPFFTSKEGGTGLGLANARKIVELLGGVIEARDRAGGGAVFRIVLPGARRVEPGEPVGRR
ncbi:MAG: HAMP domain-containing protein [Planctomycetes bacterium]|nr:HAMP domain-containing protein [Planctomycetota bacterium]